MRKYILYFILSIILCLTSSCSQKSSDEDMNASSENDYFQYNIDDIIFAYDISKDNMLYYISKVTTDYKTGNDAQGNEISVPITEYRLTVLDPEGQLVNTYNMPVLAVNHFCVAENNDIFCVSNDNPNRLYKYNPDTQETEKIFDFTEYIKISKIDLYDKLLYFIGNSKKHIDKEYTLASVEERFSYGGERVGYINLETGELTELDIKLPVNFSKTLDGNAVIYAYDEEKGYYFTVFNKENGSLSEPIYHNLGQLYNFDIYNTDNDFMYVAPLKYANSLCIASLIPNKVNRELIPDYPITAMFNMKCQGDYTYCTDLNQKNIIRIRSSAYIRSNKQITMLTKIKSISPFGCGYNICTNILTDEEIALALLSQDSSFDICVINSTQEISENIRSKGSFYPLNEVKGVKEYLDSCFPNVKDAATNSDGEIWMLPITMDVYGFIYNEQLCKENGIEFSNNMEVDYLYNTLESLISDSSKKDSYLILNYHIMINMLRQYTRSYKSFDTELFRKVAQECKNKLNYVINDYYGNSSLMSKLSTDKYSDFLFLTPLGDDYFLKVADNEELRACKVPSLTDNKLSVASCVFITVNPASKNLKETLKYITSLCNYLCSSKEYIIFQDRSRYPDTKLMDDIYDIYANAEIVFTYPDEIYIDNFDKYLEGKMELESMIKEADRRLDIFLNE